MTALSLPFAIPGYRLIRRIGLGGMATVYLAMQESLGRLVAVKVLAAEDEPGNDLVQRFEDEARTIAGLDHPHIVGIFDVGRTSTGEVYYTMPYLANGDLAGRSLRDDPARVLAVIRALAAALGHAHAHGIVHRDVKPENVLFDALDRPLLADFGIALQRSRRTRMTREGATLGSTGYMSPEQARGQPLDGRSDLYSLGVLCHELLTGTLPFPGEDPLAVALAHLEEPVPVLPPALRAWQPVIERALAKQPEHRFQSAAAMLEALDRVERDLAEPPARPVRAWRAALERSRRWPQGVRTAALALLLVLGVAAFIAALPRTPEPAFQPAPAPRPTLPAAAPATPAPVQDSGAMVAGPPAPGTPEARQQELAMHLAQAARHLRQGQLTRPAGRSAADAYLAALELEPRQRDAVNGIRSILDHYARSAADGILRGADGTTGARRAIDAGHGLAQSAGLGPGTTTFSGFAAPIRAAVHQALETPRDPMDTTALAPLLELASSLARVDPHLAEQVREAHSRPARLLARGGRFDDHGGPPMLAVPPDGPASAPYAIGLTPVTRDEYALFVRETGRPAAACREAPRRFARGNGLHWQNPGFLQGGDHPVVCVSWDDANAYARWLSRRTGAVYRLPAPGEWLHAAAAASTSSDCGVNLATPAGPACTDAFTHTSPVQHFPARPPGLHDMVGNVSEWVAGCRAEGRDGCRERQFRGLSWRDDAGASNLEHEGGAAGDAAFATIGFRVARELPAPPARTARAD